jgi:hypothetical protein
MDCVAILIRNSTVQDLLGGPEHSDQITDNLYL